MDKCPQCGAELNEENKCASCGYCSDHCHCGSEPEAEIQNESVEENVGENKDDVSMDAE